MLGSPITRKDLEAALLKLYSHDPSEAQITSILQDTSQWPLQLFVSPERENALSWYDFDPHAHLLDATTEYGSMAGLLAQRCASVSVLFEGKTHKQILQARFKTSPTIELISSNKLPNSTYDYIIISDIMRTWQNIQDNFELLSASLKPTGTIVLLANNRLGAQYLAGVPDSHDGQLFASINSAAHTNPYGTRKGIQTFFSKRGFETTYYYPLPNYTFASEVFSEEHLTSRSSFLNTESLPVAARYFSREYLFDEKAFFEHASEEGVLNSLCNSFIIIAERRRK